MTTAVKQTGGEPWRVPARKPAPGRYRIGPEFPGCCNTGTRPILFHLWSEVVPRSKQRYFVCHEVDRDAVAKLIVRGEATGKRVLRAKGWHGPAYVFKGRKAAVAKFEGWCEELQAQYDAMRREAARLKKIANPATPEGIAAILALGDMGI